jgi:hypothetical protein
VLDKDLPKSNLRKGDLGTIVEMYDLDGVEVEFVAAAGKTTAVITLTANDIRRVSECDMLAVLPLND